MPQLFRLAVPRARSALGWTGDFRGILFNTAPADLVYLLLTINKPNIIRYSSNATAPATTAKTAVTFSDLPIEIHRLICEHIDDAVDLIHGNDSPLLLGHNPRNLASPLRR
ncbi:hypothetical protein VE03_10190 [Pseudogymnoascus sp. 23342-1-I1]|nr:hypothetical protein VE03_10190 [Pseudogymnoascus sp. 23342-1-I1]